MIMMDEDKVNINMNKVCRDIFRAVHEGKWLRIEYENKEGEITKFWIGIYDIDVRGGRLIVDALNIASFQYGERYSLFINKIIINFQKEEPT